MATPGGAEGYAAAMHAADRHRHKSLTAMLAGRVPDSSRGYVVELLSRHPVDVELRPPRRSKLGDYTPPRRGSRRHRITINEDLNVYAFLTTLLHETAHLQTHLAHRRRVRPHGVEWKRAFGGILEPVVAGHGLPDDVVTALGRYLRNPRAASCTDRLLFETLRRYDSEEQQASPTLDELPAGSLFRLANGGVFRHRRRLRRWHLCVQLPGNKEYRIRGSCPVEPLPADPPW